MIGLAWINQISHKHCSILGKSLLKIRSENFTHQLKTLGHSTQRLEFSKEKRRREAISQPPAHNLLTPSQHLDR